MIAHATLPTEQPTANTSPLTAVAAIREMHERGVLGAKHSASKTTSYATIIPGTSEDDDQNIPSIRVIACPGGADRFPQHARALQLTPSPTWPGTSQGLPRHAHTFKAATLNLQGVPFELDAHERLCAIGAGILFTATTLAAILL